MEPAKVRFPGDFSDKIEKIKDDEDKKDPVSIELNTDEVEKKDELKE